MQALAILLPKLCPGYTPVERGLDFVDEKPTAM